MMADFVSEAQQLFGYTQELRREFHRFPELGFQVFRTAGIVARELNKLGLEVSTGIAQTGVVAILESDRPGPVMLLRFDMDALPIHEQTGSMQDSGRTLAGCVSDEAGKPPFSSIQEFSQLLPIMRAKRAKMRRERLL